MKLKDQFSLRSALVFLIAVPVALILILPMAWNVTFTVVNSTPSGRDQQYRDRRGVILSDRDLKPVGTKADRGGPAEGLSEQEKQEIVDVIREATRETHWFAVTLIASATVLGIVGFFSGFLARSWLLAGVVSAFSFLATAQFALLPMPGELSGPQKIIVLVLIQFAICYLLAYCGARLGLRRLQKKREKHLQREELRSKGAL